MCYVQIILIIQNKGVHLYFQEFKSLIQNKSEYKVTDDITEHIMYESFENTLRFPFGDVRGEQRFFYPDIYIEIEFNHP